MKLLLCLLVTSLFSASEVSADCAPCEIRKEIEGYPHLATKERAELIKSRYTSVEVGMTTAEVLAILGEPEEQYPWYQFVAARKPKGFSYFYVMQRLVRNGGARDRDEKVVVVRFALDEKVAEVAHWGF